MEDDALLKQAQKILRSYKLHARKGLGQHFLIDADALTTIVETAEIMPGDTVIEIGPGLGVLTRELLDRAGRVITVELDDKLAAILHKTLGEHDKLSVVHGDVLKIDPAALLVGENHKATESALKPVNYKLVANLPYYITSLVLRHFLEASMKPRRMVVMVQKEVAETIAAKPGKMSLLSVSIQFYGKPEIACYVPAASFYPAPEVDSAVVKIDVYSEPKVRVTSVRGFFDLVRAGFSASRKQLCNSLAQGLGVPKEMVIPILENAGIDLKRRAETLSVEEWAHLYRIYSGTGEK